MLCRSHPLGAPQEYTVARGRLVQNKLTLSLRKRVPESYPPINKLNLCFAGPTPLAPLMNTMLNRDLFWRRTKVKQNPCQRALDKHVFEKTPTRQQI